MTADKKQPRLRLVAGTDVVAPSPPATSRPAGGDPLVFFDQIEELIQRHKEAYDAYRQAVADIAQRTGRTVSSVGHSLAAEKRRRSRAQRAGAERLPSRARGEPLEDLEWYNLL